MRPAFLGWALLLLASCNLSDLTSGDAGADAAETGSGADSAIGPADGAEDSRLESGPSDAGTDAADATLGPPDGSFFVGGNISGLPADAAVRLQINDAGTAIVSGIDDAGTVPFAFTTPIDGAYAVTVVTQPSSAPVLCAVTAGAMGTAGAFSASAVAVSCDTVEAMAAGQMHTCALLTHGAVDCWGDNSNGELGNGGTVDTTTPTPVMGIFNATAIAAGSFHTCIIENNGQVYCWGGGTYGQLGNGTMTNPTKPENSLHPVMVNLPSSAVPKEIAAGGAHTCAVLETGAVECWGDNTDGDLGDGTMTQSPYPVAVSAMDGDGGLGGATGIAAGNAHTCAILDGGKVACWGDNKTGQLGISPTMALHLSVPGPFLDVEGARLLAAGDAHTCAIYGSEDAGGAGMMCWGDDAQGQVGIPASPVSAPTNVGLASPVAVSCGTGFTCELLEGGAAYCWGSNSYGNLGIGSMTPAATSLPTQVQGMASGVAVLTAGMSHACAAGASGVSCWGLDGNGQLGDGVATQANVPALVPSFAGARGVSAGGNETCALLGGGAVACVGENNDGQLGNDVSTSASTAVLVTGISGATEVAVGGNHACAVLPGGSVECWGLNGQGQIGSGSAAASLPPTPVSGLTGVASIATGFAHTCAALGDGGVECWGSNSLGQLGNDAGIDASNVPLPVAVSGVTAVAAGESHTCAVLMEGGVECWGSNSYGELGSDAGTFSSVPVSVAISGVMAVAAGEYYTCALQGGGTVKCWGLNSDGQLGLGTTTTTEPTPQSLPLTGVTSIAAGVGATCAALSDGGIDCWGVGQYGLLGNGTPGGNLSSAAAVVGLGAASRGVTLGATHACVLDGDGGVACWGNDSDGQLGLGVILQRPAPVAVK